MALPVMGEAAFTRSKAKARLALLAILGKVE